MSITSDRIRENCFIHHLMDAAADDIEALEQEIATLTRQRDLAVEALKHVRNVLPNALWADDSKRMIDATIKESEAMAQGEKGV